MLFLMSNFLSTRNENDKICENIARGNENDDDFFLVKMCKNHLQRDALPPLTWRKNDPQSWLCCAVNNYRFTKGGEIDYLD